MQISVLSAVPQAVGEMEEDSRRHSEMQPLHEGEKRGTCRASLISHFGFGNHPRNYAPRSLRHKFLRARPA
jgi:hypothetical protein